MGSRRFSRATAKTNIVLVRSQLRGQIRSAFIKPTLCSGAYFIELSLGETLSQWLFPLICLSLTHYSRTPFVLQDQLVKKNEWIAQMYTRYDCNLYVCLLHDIKRIKIYILKECLIVDWLPVRAESQTKDPSRYLRRIKEYQEWSWTTKPLYWHQVPYISVLRFCRYLYITM